MCWGVCGEVGLELQNGKETAGSTSVHLPPFFSFSFKITVFKLRGVTGNWEFKKATNTYLYPQKVSKTHASVATVFPRSSGYLTKLLFHFADKALLFQVKYFYLKIHISL